MKKLLVILLLFFVVGCSEKNEQIFCYVKDSSDFEVTFNQKEQYIILDGRERRNRIKIFDRGRKWTFVEISEKEYERIHRILVLSRYETKAGIQKRKKTYSKWFILLPIGSGESVWAAAVDREYVEITDKKITYEHKSYYWMSMNKVKTYLKSSTMSERIDTDYDFTINRITGDVTYRQLTQDWDDSKKRYKNVEYKRYYGKCSKDRKF